MTTGMNLWDVGVWNLIITLTLLFASMLLANILRNSIAPLRRMMIPSSVLGGFLLLLVNFGMKKLFDISLYETSVLEILTYHGLGLGFAAMALRNIEKKQDKRSRTGGFDAGVTVVSGYLLQAICGLIISIVMYKLIGSFYASGTLLPMGYGQGPGQAYNWGHTYEAGYGFTSGTSFGLTIAAMGFVSASIGGVIYLNWLRKKGLFFGETGKNVDEKLTVAEFTGENEIPLSESMDKFTIQMGIVFMAYILAYIFMNGVNSLVEAGVFGGFGATVQSMIWGFQFLFSTLFALLLKACIGSLRRKNVIKRDYINNFMLNRISGFMFDLMVVASIAAIDLSAFTNHTFVIPLTLICVAGAFATYFYLKHICRRVFPMYEHEAFLSLYGMQTGTASTGAILLREIDPKFETQASDNLVYHQPWAILFGFPMFLLVGVAPQSLGKSLFTLGMCAALFAVMYVILMRKFIFKKKKK